MMSMSNQPASWMKNETGTPNKIQDMLPMSLDAG
jgi:hypothetical protein